MLLLRRIVKAIFSSVFLAVVTFVGAPLALATTVLAGLILLPLPASIPIPKAQRVIEPTVIYDRFGHPIATLQQYDQNIPITQADVPATLKEAVISDEDHGFFHHGGIDLRGTLRAFVADVQNKRVVQGGSTITQQYVKLAYTNGQRTILRKIHEAILASQLNRAASKAEILYRYLTIVYFGDGNYGAGAAAQEYFHVPLSQLNASQAATLSGLIPEPTARAPREHIGQAEQYRELVLGKMLKQGYLTQAGYDQAMSQRLVLVPNGATPAPGTTPVYEPPTPVTAYPDFVDEVERWLLGHYPTQEVYGGGLRVQTTLDPNIENDARAAQATALQGTAAPTDMAMAAVEPSTGYIEAIIGSRTFATPLANVNIAVSGCDPEVPNADPRATCWDQPRILQGGSPGRQPGSSWKPFSLATAFEQGIPPTKVYNAPNVLQIPGCVVARGKPADTCQIHNDEGGGGGNVTLAAATAASINTVYAQVASEVGCPNVARTAQAMGIGSAYYSPTKFPYCQTYALGVLDVSPLDMASAYGVF
ncbi:MAG: transglycosylase domain-containing protein, partial [Acidimicrobiales bacterium]